MSLSGSCLTIAEYADVISIKSALYKLRDLFENFLVLALRAKDSVKRERVILSGDRSQTTFLLLPLDLKLF